MQTAEHGGHHPPLDRRLNDIGWGLLLMLTGLIWLLPPADVPPGAWFFGVAVILFGVSLVRYLNRVAIGGVTLALAVAALVAGLTQVWRSDPPLVAIVLLAIGAGLVARPLFTRTA